MRNIVILISGTGSNMSAIVEVAARDHWSRRYGARIAAVISNRPGATGLDFAASRGIDTHVLVHGDFADRPAFDSALKAQIDRYQSDFPVLVVLAGFMRILTPDFVDHYSGRLLNIHPSLLPAFSGLNTHQRALDAGCRIAGATVHQVTAELDHGPILAQAAVPILANDTATTLASRVLAQEHLIYPKAIAQWLQSAQAAAQLIPV